MKCEINFCQTQMLASRACCKQAYITNLYSTLSAVDDLLSDNENTLVLKDYEKPDIGLLLN